MQLQIEPAGKILGRSVTFGPKSVQNSSDLDNFFELTTPIRQVSELKAGWTMIPSWSNFSILTPFEMQFDKISLTMLLVTQRKVPLGGNFGFRRVRDESSYSNTPA